ncbi:MAG: glycosyltransferase family 2 protein [Akkermansia sp.]
MKLTIIVPCYNEEPVIDTFYQETCKVLATLPSLDVEFLFVDDGSSDQTLDRILQLKKQDSSVQYITFSRNFGKEAAIYAGLKYASGDYTVLMDADLQDPPSLLPEMIHILESGEYDSVGTRRVSRQGEPPIRSFFARIFYRFINQISKIQLVDGARDYRMMKRHVVDALLEMSEVNRFSKGLMEWVGFKTKWLEYTNIQRVAGETKWSFWKLFIYSIEGIISFSTIPLALASWVGVFMCLASLVAISTLFIRQMIYHNSVGGWTSLVCIFIFVSGIQFLCLGIIGQYLSKTYTESKKRPIFIAKDKSVS